MVHVKIKYLYCKFEYADSFGMFLIVGHKYTLSYKKCIVTYMYITSAGD